MSVGTSTLTLTATQASKLMVTTGGPSWFRNLVTMTLTGHTGHTPGNLLLLVYRGDTLVAYSEDFAGSNSSCSGTLDLNTSEMEDVFDGVTPGGIREFDLYLYDSDPTSLDLVAMGAMDVRSVRDYAVTAPVAPISDTTVFIGSFAFYTGKTYIRDMTTGLYHEFRAATINGSVTEALDSVGITIPGAPAL